MKAPFLSPPDGEKPPVTSTIQKVSGLPSRNVFLSNSIHPMYDIFLL